MLYTFSDAYVADEVIERVVSFCKPSTINLIGTVFVFL